MNLFGIAVIVTIVLAVLKAAGLIAISWAACFIPLAIFGVLALVVLVFALFGVLAAFIAHRISK